MIKNMGNIDKTVRILAAAIFVGLFITETVTGITGTVLMALAVVFILTSFMSFCPLYLPFKISTCKEEQRS